MAINTLITLKDALTTFVDEHEQLKRIEFEADDYRAPKITEGDEFPVLFVAPIGVDMGNAMNMHRIRIYVYERINDDRSDVWENANDTSLMLRDIRVWWNSYSDSDIMIMGDPSGEFKCGDELDNVVGYYADFVFEIPSHGRCDVPINVNPDPSPTCDPATVNVNQSDGTLISSVTAPSGGVEPYNVADSTITVNGDTYTDLKATDSLNIPIVDSNGDAVNTTVVGSDVQVDDLPCSGGVTRSTATLLKTGQTTSYATGDDGDLQAGRDVDFFTLDAAPIHNDGSATINTTTNRFTDTLGGQTYANDIVLDWSTWNGSTLLGYYRNLIGNNNINWNDLIDGCIALSVGSFSSGWRLWNANECYNAVLQKEGVRPLNYFPFNINMNIFIYTSTTELRSTYAIGLDNLHRMSSINKINTAQGIAVRTFNLSTTNILS